MGPKIRSWRGKHTLLLSREAGSMFFLGEIYTDLPVAGDRPTGNYCGSCKKCIDICPTQAILARYRVDARRRISYLTIEHKGSIPKALRPLIGNRVYGRDDCQLICPWNKFAVNTVEEDFAVRMAWMTYHWQSYSTGIKRSSMPGLRADRYGVLVTSNGCVIWR
jgi:epoxyqueuosine reductase